MGVSTYILYGYSDTYPSRLMFKKDDRKYCYIWSHNNYPIAKMEMCGKNTDESL